MDNPRESQFLTQPELTPLEQEVLEEYERLAENMKKVGSFPESPRGFAILSFVLLRFFPTPNRTTPHDFFPHTTRREQMQRQYSPINDLNPMTDAIGRLIV